MSFPMGVTAPIPVTTARRAASRGRRSHLIGQPSAYIRYIRRAPSTLVLEALQDDRAVVAAQAHRVRERHAHIGGAGLVGHVIERELGIGMAVVDRRRD